MLGLELVLSDLRYLVRIPALFCVRTVVSRELVPGGGCSFIHQVIQCMYRFVDYTLRALLLVQLLAL